MLFTEWETKQGCLHFASGYFLVWFGLWVHISAPLPWVRVYHLGSMGSILNHPDCRLSQIEIYSVTRSRHREGPWVLIRAQGLVIFLVSQVPGCCKGERKQRKEGLSSCQRFLSLWPLSHTSASSAFKEGRAKDWKSRKRKTSTGPFRGGGSREREKWWRKVWRAPAEPILLSSLSVTFWERGNSPPFSIKLKLNLEDQRCLLNTLISQMV